MKRAPAAAVAVGAAAGGLGAATLTAAPARAATTSSSPTAGVWVPPAWGQFAGPKLRAAAGTGHATVALVGDSICRGFFSSDLDARGWGGLVGAGLRAAYGDGGSGFRSAADSAAWFAGVSGLSSPSTAAFYTAAGNLLTVSPEWVPSTANFLGPAGAALKAASPSATITAAVRGSTVKVIWLDGGSEAMGAFSYSVDGAAPVTVRPTGVYRIAVSATTGLAAGDHTVTVTATGASSTTKTVIIGVAGEHTSGCTVNQFSRYGQTAAAVNSSDTLRSGTWNGGWRYPADLVVYALGANDAHGGASADTWSRNVRTWLSGVYDTTYGGSSVGAVDGVLVLSHIGNYDSSADLFTWQDYAVRARGIAEAYNLLLVDLWAIGRNSWNFWRAQAGGSYWANAASPGQVGADGIHLSDPGHAFVAQTVLGAITANLG